MHDPDLVARFIESMPARYAQMFELDTIEQHARTVRARGTRAVNLGLFDSSGRVGTAICVVAPDRPGLLATATLAFVACQLDIVQAEVFTRRDEVLGDEAVDLFWVRRQPRNDASILTPADIRQIRDTLADLVRRAPKELVPPALRSQKTPAATGTWVHFLEDVQGRFATLEIETADRTGLLFGVCQALFNEGIQIVGSRITTDLGRIKGRFEITELSDTPVEESRRHLIKIAILAAVDNLSIDAASLMTA